MSSFLLRSAVISVLVSASVLFLGFTGTQAWILHRREAMLGRELDRIARWLERLPAGERRVIVRFPGELALEAPRLAHLVPFTLTLVSDRRLASEGSLVRPVAGEFLVATPFERLSPWQRGLRVVWRNFHLLILCVAACFVAAFLPLRAMGRRAEEVIGAIRSGDLKARFPQGRFDEVGRLAAQFNRMADEIERLVGRLKESENNRRQLISELAHDVRTPLTSLRYLLEAAADKHSSWPRQRVAQTFSVALQELDYFQRLVEDLFLLAQLEEPGYRPEGPPSALRPILEAERERVGTVVEKVVRLSWEAPEDLMVRGEAQLVRRLMRNALENAARFAASEVTVSVKSEGDRIAVRVRDDGPGFTEEALSQFGTRRTARVVELGRVSLGMGTAILKAVAEGLAGEAVAGNWFRPDGSRGGAEVTIRLPRSFPER